MAVVGGGAIGGYLSARLAEAGRAVTVCVRRHPGGLVLESGGTERAVPVAFAAAPGETGPADWVIVTVKAHHDPSAWLDVLVADRTRVVVVQNGIAHARQRRGLVPALAYIAVERSSPGHLVHRTGNRLVVAAGDTARALDALFAGTVEIRAEADFLTAAWRKLLTNVAANPITALTLRRMDVLSSPGVREVFRQLVTEAVAIAVADGARLSEQDVEATMDFYARFSGEDGTSMLYDRLAGRPLEYEAITGAVVERAHRYGVPAPINETLLALLRALRSPSDALG
ncbi:ketopantoate reductase family protein [Nonomuraea zeae]|uniref:ketopantoate reductase family protein n=1 Tax=Nonomuraea zeae TaxID=1642303 RepID=UPI001478F10F|nr:2-dehydropantoate 2-reductase [Nonomuraea zeae]